MKNHRNAWLAGIAVLALVAGAGLASGQETSTGQSHGGKAQATQQQNKSSSSGKMSQGAGQGKMNQGNQGAAENKAGESKAGKSAEQERGSKASQRAEEKNKANENRSAQGQREGQGKSATEQRNQTSTGSTAQQQNRTGNQPNAAQQGRAQQGTTTKQGTAQGERNGMQGLQGNATGMNVQLTSEQRTQIRNTVINARGAPRVGQVDFDVTVGTAIPRGRIHVIQVPETLIRIEPRWRGFLYFVYEDEVVIVDPHDYKIVAVVPA
jgi:Protein of unknown function (DUF1236)